MKSRLWSSSMEWIIEFTWAPTSSPSFILAWKSRLDISYIAVLLYSPNNSCRWSRISFALVYFSCCLWISLFMQAHIMQRTCKSSSFHFLRVSYSSCIASSGRGPRGLCSKTYRMHLEAKKTFRLCSQSIKLGQVSLWFSRIMFSRFDDLILSNCCKI